VDVDCPWAGRGWRNGRGAADVFDGASPGWVRAQVANTWRRMWKKFPGTVAVARRGKPMVGGGGSQMLRQFLEFDRRAHCRAEGEDGRSSPSGPNLTEASLDEVARSMSAGVAAGKHGDPLRAARGPG